MEDRRQGGLYKDDPWSLVDRLSLLGKAPLGGLPRTGLGQCARYQYFAVGTQYQCDPWSPGSQSHAEKRSRPLCFLFRSSRERTRRDGSVAFWKLPLRQLGCFRVISVARSLWNNEGCQSCRRALALRSTETAASRRRKAATTQHHQHPCPNPCHHAGSDCLIRVMPPPRNSAPNCVVLRIIPDVPFRA